jgi:hypothetical protein
MTTWSARVFALVVMTVIFAMRDASTLQPAGAREPAPGLSNPTDTEPPVTKRTETKTHRAFLSMVSISAYDRERAATYAIIWAHGRNPNYRDYGSGCACNDCTNFVSQALFAGGKVMKTGSYDKASPFEWWYYNSLNVFGQASHTWGGTPQINTYFHQFPREYEAKNSSDELVAGDMIILDLAGDSPADPPDGQPDHARMVVGFGKTSTDPVDYSNGCGRNHEIPPEKTGVLVSQHCVDRNRVIWNYRADDPNIRYWFWHVT